MRRRCIAANAAENTATIEQKRLFAVVPVNDQVANAASCGSICGTASTSSRV
jgi:hypothetical protein